MSAMRTIETDVVILGAGTAGLNARRAVAAADKRWVLVEGAVYGTMCARVGCMPSKLLIAAGERAHDIAHAEIFGLRLGADAFRVDGPAVLERVRRERDRFVGFVLESNERLPKDQNLFGMARFIAPTSVVVGDQVRVDDGSAVRVDDGSAVRVDDGSAVRVDASAVVIATGTTPTVPAMYAALGDALDTNDTIFERPDLPKSLAVIGTGVIGLELGQAMHRLGVKVRFFSRAGRFAGLSDPAVAASARAVLKLELAVSEGEVTAAVRTPDGGARLTWREGVRECSGTFERVLVAVGRHPNIAGLDFAQTGVALDAQGVPRFDAATLQCAGAPIFLAGDITGRHPLLHEAVDDGRIAGTNAARYPDIEPGVRRVPLAITFCDPNIAVVGERWSPALAVGEVDYARQGRARIMGKNAGVVHVYGRHDDRRVVGAEMCGPRVEHLAHLVAWAVQSKLTVEQMLAMPFYHPVIEEGLRTALQDLQRMLDAPRA